MSTDPGFPLPPFPGQGGPLRPQPGLSPIARFRTDLYAATPRVFVTHLIIAVNVAVYVLMMVKGGSLAGPSTQQMLQWGAGYGPLTTNGQPWRLFTEMFLHFSPLHIGMNMFVLWQAGPLVERLFGNFPYLVIYILSGLVGSFFSLYAHPDSITAGASGAVFGVYGALLGFLAIQRLTVPGAIVKSLFNSAGIFVIYNLVIGFSMKQVDMYAHGGGLMGGAVLGALLSRKLVRNANRVRAVAVALLGAFVAFYLATHLHPISYPDNT